MLNYDDVLKDLELRRNQCKEELRRLTEEARSLDQVIAGLRQLASPVGAEPDTATRAQRPPISELRSSPAAAYAGLSVRWAILYLLAEHALGPLGRTDIADKLHQGGITSAAQNFASNVSAVLSGMANARREVEQIGSGYQITPHGREVWEGIKRTPQWAARRSENRIASA